MKILDKQKSIHSECNMLEEIFTRIDKEMIIQL